MQLFYNKNINNNTNFFSFNKEESKHIIKVLRKKIDDILYVTNGFGVLFKVKIITDLYTKCDVEIIDSKEDTPRKFNLHLAVAPTKMNERFEWFLEKATEIGIQEISPIICEHSERKVINIERFQKIILSAMKQSKNLFLPKLNQVISFENFIKQDYKSLKYIAHCEELEKKTLQSVLKPNENITLLIGPEGDFSNKEIIMAIENNYQPVSLGNTRLRTETAAIVACHSVVFFNDQMKY